MEHLDKTLQAAKDFKVIATQLVKALCALGSIDFSNPDRNWLLRKAFGKQIEHALDNDWTFCLHGAECRFVNKYSDQEIEVIMIYGQDCGVLDPYFFYKFCENSNDYKPLAEFYKGDYETILQDFLALYRQGHLLNVGKTESDLIRSLTT